MRFHVINLPHTSTVKAQSTCAYTNKVRRFCDMMTSLHHEVFLYGGPENEAACTEFIPLFTAKEQVEFFGENAPEHGHVDLKWGITEPYWAHRNIHAIKEINKRIKKKDFICLFDGNGAPIQLAFEDQAQIVEAGVGYSGTFSKYRVFESYAWMHSVMGAQAGQAGREVMNEYGNNFDAVIPNYFDVDDFPFSAEKDDYFLFIGRVIPEKGIEVVREISKHITQEIVIAGQGDDPGFGKFVGVIGPEERGRLMSRAKAVLVPSLYLEPFGGVSAEAMLCGTPVISSDWGAFTENVEHDVTGYRCRTLKEFIQATNDVENLYPSVIRNFAVNKFSTDIVRFDYQNYFRRLLTLWDGGWYKL